jgi:hypothetical protein
MRLLREMAVLLEQHSSWTVHRAARHVAERVNSESDWRDRPTIALDSLREKLKSDFAKHSVELRRHARAEASRRDAVSNSRAGSFSSQTTRVTGEAVHSAQRTLDWLPRWMRDENFMRQFERWEREAKLRAFAEQFERLRRLGLIDP